VTDIATPGPTRSPWRSHAGGVAVGVAVVDLVALVVLLVTSADQKLWNSVQSTGSWINLIAGPTFPLIGALLLRPTAGPGRRRLAWLFVGFGALCTATYLLHDSAKAALDQDLAVGPALAWVSTWLWIGVPSGLLLLLLWFPTGAVPGRRWRWAERAIYVYVPATWLSVAFRPGETEDFPGFDNPLGVPGATPLLAVFAVAGGILLAGAAFATLASVLWRFRTGTPEERAQLRWLVVAVSVIAVTLLLPSPDALYGATLVINILATLLLPLTLAVALLRRDGLVLPRLLVYGLLSFVLLLAYVAVVGLAQAVFGSSSDRAAALVAAGLVAVLAAPVRARLQSSVDRLVYGDRGDPHAALVDFGRRLSGSPDDLLREVVGTVADALRAPYVAVVLTGDPEPAASTGTPGTGTPVSLTLLLRGDEVGSLVVSPRGPRERYGRRDLELLGDLARHVAVVAHAAALTRDLQRSRESLVVAREEERRRIRRDLHDGLGPALAGVALGIDAARRTLAADPAVAERTLAELTVEVQSSIADVRRLVYDLRPPTLDHLGLVPALEEYAARLTERGGLDVSVATGSLPELPAAVEVAAYRIVTEALTNAARHSGARTGRVSLCVAADQLRLEVLDDGVGLPLSRRAGGTGVGLAAMAERAAELGGRCTVAGGPGGGTQVLALLPLVVRPAVLGPA
jgi:signal transduction histidine kinase